MVFLSYYLNVKTCLKIYFILHFFNEWYVYYI